MLTQEQVNAKIKLFEKELKKETDDKKRKRIQKRLYDLRNYYKRRQQDAEGRQKKSQEKREKRQQSIAILKSRTAFELAYIKYTKEDNKKFFSTKIYYE